MKYDALVDAPTRSALRLAWLDGVLEPVSEYGRRAAAAVSPFAPGEEERAQQHAGRIFALAQALEASRADAVRDALRLAPDAHPAIARAGMGDVLTDANFLELQRFLDVAQRVDALLDTPGVAVRCTSEAAMLVARTLERGRSGKFGFYLDDAFESSLGTARARAQQAQAELDAARGRLARRVGEQLQREDVSGDEFIVMRDALNGPLPPEIRVIREAPTYLLCELELDDAALRALERRDASADAVAQAEEAARAALSQTVRMNSRALHDVARALGEIDVLAAQIRFVRRHACVVPEIVAQPQVVCTDASFLPLRAELEREGRRYEPISFELSGVSVLTGPNMGGKSVALRTCGFLAVLAAFGLPVPAVSARVCLFDDISWLGIGAEEDAGGLLSSFAREVVRLRELLERSSQRSLLLLDEFARTTTPHEGKALLVALIDSLRTRGRLAFVATHLSGVARAAGARHFAVRGLRGVPKQRVAGDLHAALAALGESMDYSIVEVGEAGETQADAIALAHLLGLDDEIVAMANAALLQEARAPQ